MKALFDTSTLVAALLRQHPHHAPAFSRLLAAHQGRLQAWMTTHGLAEVFATLTALPLKPRLSPADAQRMIEHTILPRFKVLPLAAKHYTEALNLTVGHGLSSGAI